MADQFLRISEIQEQHPEADAQLMQSWTKFCPWLNRAIKFKPDPENASYRLYSADDIDDALMHRRTEAPAPRFTDDTGDWAWLQLLRRDVQRKHKTPLPFKMSAVSFRNWQESGCVALDGRKPEIRRIYYWPNGEACKRRDYIRFDEMKEISDARHKSVTADVDCDWIAYKKALHYFAAPTLIQYSNSEHYHREKPGKPHPLLGRFIKTDVRKTITNGQTVTTVWFWLPDLKIVATDPTYGDWADYRQARDEYKIASATLDAAIKRGQVKPKRFPMPRARGRKNSTLQLYRRDELRSLADAPDASVDNLLDALDHQDSKLDGIHRDVRRTRLATVTTRNDIGEQLREIKSVIPRTERDAGEQGRPLTADERNRRTTVLNEWKDRKSYYRNNGGREAFAKLKGITVKTLEDWQSWQLTTANGNP